MRKYTHICLLSLCFFSFQIHANEFADDTKLPTWWYNIGFGYGDSFKSESGRGQSSLFGFNGVLSENTLFTVYSYRASRDRRYDMSEAGTMLGYVKRHPDWFWSISSGISYYQADTVNFGSRFHDIHRNEDFALPIHAQIFMQPFKHFGFGLIGHVSINEQSFASVLFAIQIC